MDWLRIGAFGLLILYHVGMYFVPWGWHVKIAEPIEAARIPMLATNTWRLALLFAVSGYASHHLMTRLGRPAAFLRSRSARLLVPLVFGMAVIVPVQPWIELMVQHGYAHGFRYFWTRDYFRFGQLDGIDLPTWNHLWFVAYLWVYSMLAGIAFLLPGGLRRAAAHVCERALSGPLVLIVPMALLVLQEFVLFPGMGETHGLFDDWPAHIIYFPIFLFGWLLAGSAPLWRAIRACWPAAGLLSLGGYAAVLAVLPWPAGEFASEPARITFELARIVQGWGAVIALIGLADRFLNRDHPWRRTLTEGVFPFYIVHQSIIVLVGWWLLGAGLPPLAQFALLVAATAAGCWLFYRLGREIPGVRLLLGLKGFWPPRGKEMVPRGGIEPPTP